MDPMATTVAGPEPEMAAKKMQARTPEIPSPPGIQPTSELMNADQAFGNGALGHD